MWLALGDGKDVAGKRGWKLGRLRPTPAGELQDCPDGPCHDDSDSNRPRFGLSKAPQTSAEDLMTKLRNCHSKSIDFLAQRRHKKATAKARCCNCRMQRKLPKQTGRREVYHGVSLAAPLWQQATANPCSHVLGTIRSFLRQRGELRLPHLEGAFW